MHSDMEIWSEIRREVLTGALSKRAASAKYTAGRHSLARLPDMPHREHAEGEVRGIARSMTPRALQRDLLPHLRHEFGPGYPANNTAAQSHDGHSRRHAAAIGEPFDEYRHRRNVSQPEPSQRPQS